MGPFRRVPPKLAAAAVAVAAFALALVTALDERAREGERAAVLRRLGEAPLTAERRDELAALTHWQEDPTQLRLDLARLLVNDALTTAPADAAERAATLERLDLARSFAAEAYARRPAAWRGPTLLGASIYLGRTLARDRRLVTESAAWDEPLAWARELVPGHAEPARFTALAYLELWPALSADKRRLAVPLLRRTFEDGRFFGRLLEPWLRRADDRETALAAIPPRPSAWRTVLSHYADGGDWDGFLAAREGWRRAVETTMEEDFAAARRLARRGDAWEARLTYLRAVADAPPEARFAPLVERGLTSAPRGLAPAELAAPLGRWLDWVLRLSLVGETPLSADAVTRLAGAVADLEPARAAHAAVVAGRLADGERLERRARGAGAGAGAGAAGRTWARRRRPSPPRPAPAEARTAGSAG